MSLLAMLDLFHLRSYLSSKVKALSSTFSIIPQQKTREEWKQVIEFIPQKAPPSLSLSLSIYLLNTIFLGLTQGWPGAGYRFWPFLPRFFYIYLYFSSNETK